MPAVPNLPGERPHPDPRIEDYLDRVCAPLVGRLPYQRRQELRAEMRDHLAALVLAHRELGADAESAGALALAQFGPPRHVARELAHACLAPTSPWSGSWVPAFGIAVAAFAVALHFMSPSLDWAWMVGWDRIALDPRLIAHGPVLEVPMVAGLLVGLLAPGRRVLGTFLALSLLSLAYDCSALAISEHLIEGTNLYSDPLGACVLGVLWIPLGCLATRVGSELRPWLIEALLGDDRWPWSADRRMRRAR